MILTLVLACHPRPDVLAAPADAVDPAWRFDAGVFGANVPDLSAIPAPVAARALALAVPGCTEDCLAALKASCGGPIARYEDAPEAPITCTRSLTVSGPLGGMYTIDVRGTEDGPTASFDSWDTTVVRDDGSVVNVPELFPLGTKFATLAEIPEAMPACEDPETLIGGWWAPTPDGVHLSTLRGHAAGHRDHGCDVVVPWDRALAAGVPGGPLEAYRDLAVRAPGPVAPSVQSLVSRAEPWSLTLAGGAAAPESAREAAVALACRAITGAPCASPLHDLAQLPDGGPMGADAVVRLDPDGSGWRLIVVGANHEDLARERVVAPRRASR